MIRPPGNSASSEFVGFRSEFDAAVESPKIAHLPVDAVPPHQVVDAEGDERQQRHRPRAAELDAIAAPPDQQFLGHVRLNSAWRSARLYAAGAPGRHGPAAPCGAQPPSAATIRGNTSRGASRPKKTSMCEKPGRILSVADPGRRAFSHACVRRWPEGRKQRFSAPASRVKRGGGARRRGGQVVGQAANGLVDRDEGPGAGAGAHLAEERGRHPAELAADPRVRGRREVLVAPEHVGPRAVGEVRDRADGVVAFAPRELGEPGEAAGAQAGRADRPLRIEAAS